MELFEVGDLVYLRPHPEYQLTQKLGKMPVRIVKIEALSKAQLRDALVFDSGLRHPQLLYIEGKEQPFSGYWFTHRKIV